MVELRLDAYRTFREKRDVGLQRPQFAQLRLNSVQALADEPQVGFGHVILFGTRAEYSRGAASASRPAASPA